MILASKKYNYLIYTSPKSASTTIRKLFLEVHRDEFPSFANEHTICKFSSIKKQEEKSYLKIFVFRNPYDRIISLYFDKIIKLYSDVKQIHPQESLKKYLKLNFGQVCPLFDKFLHIMKKPHTNHHFTGQICFNEEPNFIYSTTEINKLVNHIESITGIKTNLTKQNSNCYTKEKTENILEYYQKNKKFPNPNYLLNIKRILTIEKIYKQDFQYLEKKNLFYRLSKQHKIW